MPGKPPYNIAFHRLIVEMHLDLLREYVVTMASALHNEFQAFERRLTDMTTAYSQSDPDELYEIYADDGFKLRDDFPVLANNTTFIAIYSFLEHVLVDLCAVLQEDQNYELALRDISGQGIDQCFKYLTKFCGLKIAVDGAEWKEIKELQKVRNVIAHKRGYLEPPSNGNGRDNDVRKYLKNKHTASIRGDLHVQLTKEFCLDVIAVIRDFLNEAFDATEERFGKESHEDRGAAS